MDEVSKALPELVWLTNLTLAGDALTLSGMAMDENAVANYISNLDASPYFQEPVLIDMSRVREETFQFRLNCVFVHTPPAIAEEEA
jgi:type IV pilus assembly protein PilN